MLTFAKKQKPAQKAKSASSTRPSRAFFGQSHEASFFRPLQRTIGNRAVQQFLRASGEERDHSSLTSVSSCFGHEFNRIPVHASGNDYIQSKLRISAPGDNYEQEADRVAEQVMRTPDVELQHACPCGGGCPRCQTKQLGSGNEPRKTRLTRDGRAAVSMVQPAVDDVLRSPGKPLDTPTKTFMERRLGYDFSRVRVHSDVNAAAAAQAVQARAFTFGRDVVFGAQEYRPGTTKGKQLLTHELVHVVQQAQSRPVVQRQVGGNTSQPQPATVTLNVTPQISWAITALLIRPVAEEDTWACLAGVPEYDKPRVLLNYFIQYRGNSAFAQIDAQRPANVDRDTYLNSVMTYIWSLIRDGFMTMATQRMSRNAGFRTKVEEAASGRGCSTVPYITPGSGAAAV